MSDRDRSHQGRLDDPSWNESQVGLDDYANEDGGSA
jgi:hypothetical protein